jgi:carbon-monoxide dehydrogenase small subunit
MSDGIGLHLRVNGELRSIRAQADTTLLTVLRDQLLLTGAKRGCNQGVCGSCTVAIDGWPMRACLSLAVNCVDKDIVTIEGACAEPVVIALQEAFAAQGAVQCGFCSCGMLVAARRLLADHPRPSVEEVQLGLSGNLCRCTGYRKIIDAVRCAAEALHP